MLNIYCCINMCNCWRIKWLNGFKAAAAYHFRPIIIKWFRNAGGRGQETIAITQNTHTFSFCCYFCGCCCCTIQAVRHLRIMPHIKFNELQLIVHDDTIKMFHLPFLYSCFVLLYCWFSNVHIWNSKRSIGNGIY